MPLIKLTTKIKAPAQVCFDLARSIDLHTTSMQHTGEQAVAGTTSGLIGLNDTVIWRAKHFGISMEMTSKITELRYATSFTDEQINGPFKMLKHQHIFQQIDSFTIMTDHFEFASPLGILGQLTDAVVLEEYLTNLLTKRNKVIKQAAEDHEHSDMQKLHKRIRICIRIVIYRACPERHHGLSFTKRVGFKLKIT